MALSRATGFPKRATDASGAATTIDSPSFDTSPTQIYVAMAGAFADPGVAFTIAQIGGAGGGSIAWGSPIREAVNGGRVSIWFGVPTGSLVGTVTQIATTSGDRTDFHVVIDAWDGASTTVGASNTAIGTSTLASLTINALSANSVLVGIVGDFTLNQAHTPDGTTTTEDFETQTIAGDTYIMLRKTALTGAPGNATFGETSPTCTWGFVGLEIQALLNPALAGAIAGGSALTGDLTGSPLYALPGYFDICLVPTGMFDEWNTNDPAKFDATLADVSAGGLALAGAIAGASSLSATLSEATALAGAIAGASAVTGNLSEAIALAAAIAGGSVLTGNLREATALAGAIAGQSTLTGVLVEATALAGAIAGQSTLTAALTEAIALAGSISGASVLGGNLSTGSSIALAGVIAGGSALTGDLAEAVAIAGAIAGGSSLTAALAEATALAGAVAGGSVLTGALREALALSGTVAGGSSLSGTLSEGLALAGAIDGRSVLSGTLSGFAAPSIVYIPIFIFDD